MSRFFRSLAVLSVLSAALATPARAQGGKQVVNPNPGRGGGMLSPGIRVGDLVFSSGQLGGNADSTIEMQTATILNTIKRIFEAAGTTMENTAKCLVFLTDAADFQKMNGEYVKFFPADKGPPARSTVVVAALVRPSAKVEIECIAAMPK